LKEGRDTPSIDEDCKSIGLFIFAPSCQANQDARRLFCAIFATRNHGCFPSVKREDCVNQARSIAHPSERPAAMEAEATQEPPQGILIPRASPSVLPA
jgi:hypothetical protein